MKLFARDLLTLCVAKVLLVEASKRLIPLSGVKCEQNEISLKNNVEMQVCSDKSGNKRVRKQKLQNKYRKTEERRTERNMIKMDKIFRAIAR